MISLLVASYIEGKKPGFPKELTMVIYRVINDCADFASVVPKMFQQIASI